MQIGESPITNHENRSSISSASKKRTAEPLSEKYFSRKSSHTETSEKVHAECFQPAAFLLCCTTSSVLTYVQRLKNVTIIARFRAFVKPLSGREPVEAGTSKPEGSRDQNANSGAMDPEREPVEAIQKAGRSRRIGPPLF